MTVLGQTPVRDEAAGVLKLELGYSQEVQLYAHQQGALEAWNKAGCRGVVVLPNGAGKTLV
ncbi:hypothetical protein [Deinococcus sp. Leaf326]|uniref:hypothetical protein n=1 Tax=Deinococcus sp. Leaf326 TaxID=1736338 RepID=UPI0006FE9A82|nr:hypothetical protein [Deinococcus sp. Leaf326]KQR01093.1 hypothetical protein ASF71_13150 [Deinococcus sp. Leaf326]